MDRDSKLIYESYILKNYNESILVTEDTRELLNFLAKVIDPTGILSWPDFYKALGEFEKDSSIINLGIVLLTFFCALPNFGLLAAGAGGVAWGGAKAAARTAIKAGPHAILPATNKMLQILSKIPGGKNLAERSLLKLKDSGKISENAFQDITAVINSGKVTDTAHGANILSGRGGQAGAAGIGTGDILKANVGKGTAYQAGTRAAAGTIKGETGVDTPLGKDFESDLEDFNLNDDTLSSSSGASGRKAKRF